MANTQALGLGTGNNNIGGGTLDIATAGGDTVYNFTSGSGAVANIISNVASGSVGINHTLGNYFIGGSTTAGSSQLNVTAGAGITSGSPRITITALSMTSGIASPVISTLNPTTADLSIGTVTSANGSVTNTRTLNLDGTSTGNQITGAISDGPTSSISAVTKTNTSTWTLTGTNTYTGATNVNAGTLIVGVGGTGSLGRQPRPSPAAAPLAVRVDWRAVTVQAAAPWLRQQPGHADVYQWSDAQQRFDLQLGEQHDQHAGDGQHELGSGERHRRGDDDQQHANYGRATAVAIHRRGDRFHQ